MSVSKARRSHFAAGALSSVPLTEIPNPTTPSFPAPFESLLFRFCREEASMWFLSALGDEGGEQVRSGGRSGGIARRSCRCGRVQL